MSKPSTRHKTSSASRPSTHAAPQSRNHTPTASPTLPSSSVRTGDCGWNHAWDGSTTTWDAPTTADGQYKIFGKAIAFHFYLRCAEPGIHISWTAKSGCEPYGKGQLVASQQGTVTLEITFYPGREYDCLTSEGQSRSDIYLDGMQLDVDFHPAHNFDNSSGISYGDEGVIASDAPNPKTWAR